MLHLIKKQLRLFFEIFPCLNKPFRIFLNFGAVMSTIENISSDIDFINLVNKNERKLIVIHFGAEWAPQCKQINEILSEFKNQESNFLFLYVDAEKCSSISTKYNITSVPSILFLKRNQVVKLLQGGSPKDLLKAFSEISNRAASPVKAQSIEDRLKSLINSGSIMLFMKGCPDQPKCGFSRKIVQLLTDCNAVYKSFDILTDQTVREELKKFSNWPTYPQLYINGEFIGGVDICQELAESGELNNMIKDADTLKKEKLEENLAALVNREKIMLFMKGSPDSPKCGFSRNTVEILKRSGIVFGYFDILTDPEVREGLKSLFNWPTYPQLYVNGQLIGGYDIIKELDQSGELVSNCN